MTVNSGAIFRARFCKHFPTGAEDNIFDFGLIRLRAMVDGVQVQKSLVVAFLDPVLSVWGGGFY